MSLHRPNRTFTSAPRTSAIREVGARLHTFGTPLLLVLLALSLTACGGGSGGGSGDSGSGGSGSASAVQVIDLPAGLTEATLGWAPSAGRVDSYVVYESRNGGDYTFVDVVTSPRVTIGGMPGDAVRISVIATNSAGKPSNASLPSPELRFSAGPATVAALESAEDDEATLAANTALTPTGNSLASSTSNDETTSGEADGAASATETTPTTGADTDLAAGESEAADETSTLLDRSIRSLVLEADARLPLAGLGITAQGWVQERIEEQFNAGVRLVGTGELDRDGLREVIWQDPSGQLFVSMGQALVDLETSADTPSTFIEGVRLGATERFVALADWTGDGVGEWVVEDLSTGDVWMIDSMTLETSDARSLYEAADAPLVAHGDFDGDGIQAFVWQHADGLLRFGHPTDLSPALEVIVPHAPTRQLIAIADIDGNGTDDLVSVDETGRLEWTLVHADADLGVRFEAQAGPAQNTDALDLVATLDLDDDGAAEIVWLNEGELEVWKPSSIQLEATAGR